MKRGWRTLLLQAVLLLALTAAAHGADGAYYREWNGDLWDESIPMLTADTPWDSSYTRYGQQLTGDAQHVYQTLEQAFQSDTVQLTTINDKPAWRVSNVLTATVPRDTVESWWRAVWDEAMAACQAFTYDHPEYFWIRTNCGAGYSYIQDDTNAYIRLYVFYVALPSCNTVEKRDAQQARLEAAIEPILAAADGLPAVARVAYFENWLAENNTYNDYAASNEDAESNDLPWSPVGALLEEYSPVCEGYAKALQLLCRRSGVECLTISGIAGGGHMWTAVQLDGAWYFCDPTFDDQGSCSTRSYFLIGGPSSHVAGMKLTPPPLATAGYFDSGWAVSGGAVTGGEAYGGSGAAMVIALYDRDGRLLTCGTCVAIPRGGSAWMYAAPELDAAVVRSAGRITRFCANAASGQPLGAAREILT